MPSTPDELLRKVQSAFEEQAHFAFNSVRLTDSSGLFKTKPDYAVSPNRLGLNAFQVDALKSLDAFTEIRFEAML
jgi:hypothetical protein